MKYQLTDSSPEAVAWRRANKKIKRGKRKSSSSIPGWVWVVLLAWVLASCLS